MRISARSHRWENARTRELLTLAYVGRMTDTSKTHKYYHTSEIKFRNNSSDVFWEGSPPAAAIFPLVCVWRMCHVTILVIQCKYYFISLHQVHRRVLRIQSIYVSEDGENKMYFKYSFLIKKYSWLYFWKVGNYRSIHFRLDLVTVWAIDISRPYIKKTQHTMYQIFVTTQ